MNLENQQETFDLIKKTDNKDLWKLCLSISQQTIKLNKQIAKLKKAAASSKPVTDAEIREKLRDVLVKKLSDSSISAAEIAQLKDVFGLTNAKQDIQIQVVSFADIEVPK